MPSLPVQGTEKGIKSVPAEPPHRKPQTENRKLYIGPAGWDYPDWQGVVYPPGLKGADRLTFLATLFTAVEINVTFYRPITADYARRWLAAVTDFPDFRFTAKVWQVFTHDRRLPEADLAQFQAGLAPLLTGGKLGALLAQFPYSFHNTEENRAYLVQLKTALQKFPLAVEVRHRSWQQRAVREFLEHAGLDFLQHRPADGLLPHGRNAVGHRAPGVPPLPRAAAGCLV